MDEITSVQPLPGDLQYRFLAEGGRPMLYLSENSQVYLTDTDVSAYRYELSAIRGPQIAYMQTAYERLRQHECFPLAYQKFEGLTDYTYYPPNYLPDYSTITRQMPVELLLKTNMKHNSFRRELKRRTGHDFSGDNFYENRLLPAAPGVGGYIEKINRLTRSSNSRYKDIDAAYYIRIFSNDDHPLQRRLKRDTFAREVLAALRGTTNIVAEAFEIIACKFVPFT